MENVAEIATKADESGKPAAPARIQLAAPNDCSEQRIGGATGRSSVQKVS